MTNRLNNGYAADLQRRLDRTRALIEHITDMERRHPERAEKLVRERKAAEIDAIRLEALIAEAEKEPAA